MKYTVLIPIFTNLNLDQLKEKKNKDKKSLCLIRQSKSSTLKPVPTQYGCQYLNYTILTEHILE